MKLELISLLWLHQLNFYMNAYMGFSAMLSIELNKKGGGAAEI
jgi:hypothetical protein